MKSEEMLIPGRRSRSRATVSRYRSTRGGRFMSLRTPIAARLHGKVEMARELRHVVVRVHEVARHLRRVGGGVADPADPADPRPRPQSGRARLAGRRSSIAPR